MVIDITNLKDFDTSFLHHLIKHKDEVVLTGSNHRLERCIKILGLEEIIKHEKSVLNA